MTQTFETQLKKKQTIDYLKSNLNELLLTDTRTLVSRKNKPKVKGFLEDLKTSLSQKQGLVGAIDKLEATGIIKIPDEFKKITSDISSIVLEDIPFWTEIFNETSEFVTKLEEKVNKQEPGCLSGIKNTIVKIFNKNTAKKD